MSEFDLVLCGGRVVDGTGNPWFEADVAVRGDRIAAVGRLGRAGAARLIDARGRIVAPGFIDVHTHLELEEENSRIEDLPTADNLLHMGVTSVVTGNCGGSELDLGAWFDRLERTGISVHLGSLVGHNTVRREAMGGDVDRPPRPAERQRMAELVERAMLHGAMGLSTGLIYVPGTYARTDEIVELACVAAQHGGLYATHLRDEGEQVEAAILEALDIGASARCPVQISHFKVASRRRWGSSAQTVKLVEQARARGQPVTVDQYVYTAGSTTLAALFPAWIFSGGPQRVRERLEDEPTRQRVRSEMIESARQRGRTDYSFAVVACFPADPSLQGLNLAQIARLRRRADGVEQQAEQAMHMLLEGGAQMIFHTMSEVDVERILVQPFTMIACDGGAIGLDSAAEPHPRSFGNNARVLEHYVRGKHLLRLEEAVRKMTSLPAQTFGLWDRGLVRPGQVADLLVLDEEVLAERATYEQPKQHAAGVETVLVAGRIVLEGGAHTGLRPGRILRGRHPRDDD